MPSLDDKVVINLCQSGMVVTKAAVPSLPQAPEEMAADAARCRDEGASIVHLHARDELGEPAWQSSRFREILEAVSAAAPEVITVVSTSGRYWHEIDRRSDVLSLGGPIRPDMASLTLGSLNFPGGASVNSPESIAELARRMRAAGITPELEAFDAGMIDYSRHLIADQILQPPYYFNLFFGSLGAASLSAANVAASLGALPPGATWAIAGIGRYQTAAIALGMSLGGHVRVGLEDNPYYDWRDRSPSSNPKLVARCVRIARELGREPATPDEARSIIGLPVRTASLGGESRPAFRSAKAGEPLIKPS